MVNCLTSVLPNVRDYPISVSFKVMFCSKLLDELDEGLEDACMGCFHLVKAADVLLWDNKEVDGRLWVEIPNCNAFFIFPCKPCREVMFND